MYARWFKDGRSFDLGRMSFRRAGARLPVPPGDPRLWRRRRACLALAVSAARAGWRPLVRRIGDRAGLSFGLVPHPPLHPARAFSLPLAADRDVVEAHPFRPPPGPASHGRAVRRTGDYDSDDPGDHRAARLADRRLAGAASAVGTGLAITCIYEFCHCVQHLNFKPRKPPVPPHEGAASDAPLPRRGGQLRHHLVRRGPVARHLLRVCARHGGGRLTCSTSATRSDEAAPFPWVAQLSGEMPRDRPRYVRKATRARVPAAGGRRITLERHG